MTNQPFRALIHVAVADIVIFPVSVTTSLLHLFPVTTSPLHLPCHNFSVTSSLLQLLRCIFPVTSLLHPPCRNFSVTSSLLVLQLLCYTFPVTTSIVHFLITIIFHDFMLCGCGDCAEFLSVHRIL